MSAGRTLRIPPGLVEVVTRASRVFSEKEIGAYVTGGFVRDILLSRPVRDVDISIGADPVDLAPEVARALGGTSFTLDPVRRHARVLIPGSPVHIDLLPLRDQIEGDLRLRDYTIGALGVDLASLSGLSPAAILDPTNGLEDLDNGIIRAVSEQALLDDPLRLLRGIRVGAQLGFEIEADTAAMIRRHAESVRSAAPERQRDEIISILATDYAGHAFDLLESLGLLSVLIPELDVTRGVAQPKEHQWDVFYHGIEAVGALDWLLADSPPVPAKAGLWREARKQLDWLPDIHSRWDDEISPGILRLSVLKLGALLHDVGKPATRSVDPDGRIRFFGHSEAGADLARRILKRVRFPARVIDHVSAMVEAHLRPLLIAREGAPSRRAVFRFFRDTGDAGVDTLFLSLADHLATSGPRVTEAAWSRHLAVIAYILVVRAEPPATGRPTKLVNGDDLMAALGIGPGPVVGELLDAIDEALAAGEIETQDQALTFARERLARNKQSR